MKKLILSVLLAGLVSCSGGSVKVSGQLIGGWFSPCSDGTQPLIMSGMDPGNAVITFKDASGKVVGMATTGATHYVTSAGANTSASDGCLAGTIVKDDRGEAPYSVSLPHSDFYQVTVTGMAHPLWIKYADVSDGHLDVKTP